MTAYKGKITSNADTLLEVMKKNDELGYHAARVYVYANQRYHEDTAVSKYQGYSAKADSVMVALSSATSFINPEILASDETVFEQFYREKRGISRFFSRHYP
jgi:oligoendopeptidase F